MTVRHKYSFGGVQPETMFLRYMFETVIVFRYLFQSKPPIFEHVTVPCA